MYFSCRKKMENSTQSESKSEGPLFKDLNADDPEPETTEIESLCVECEEMVSCLIYFILTCVMRVIVLSNILDYV